MPPGIAWTRTPASTGSTFAEEGGWRFFLRSAKYALTFAMRTESSPVS